MNELRRFIRHAELYGVEGVWEAATNLTADELDTLARRLAHLNPEWRIPGTSSNGGNEAANPHSRAKKCHANGDSGGSPRPPAKRDKWAVCGECGETFKAARSTARYCGATCRQRAHRRVAS